MEIQPKIEESWKNILQEEFKKPYFGELKKFIVGEIKNGVTIYPRGQHIFAAFNNTPFDNVNVVVLGQDPYHGNGQAHGLCFSVPNGVPPPPSLVNIYKELHSDLGMPIPQTGSLERWAQQGVFLLNATLTVRAGQAGSHQGRGWEEFTDSIIKIVSEKKEGIIFLLWGKFAQSKQVLIDASKHFILTAAHPSPFSAHSGFFGCKHFSKTNEILTSQGKKEIDWSVE
jgi:uracil-DNA glycosylase